ncbi:MAG: sugar ABC transporter permease [Chloroflexota bacterium]
MTTIRSAEARRGAVASKEAWLTKARQKELRSLLKGLLYLSPSLLVFLLFVFYPLMRSFHLSLYATDPIGRPAVFVGLDQYQRLFNTPNFLYSLQVSVAFVLYTVPTTILAALFLAVLGSARLRGISVFRTVFSSTIAVSGATASLIFLFLYHPALGALNYFLDVLGLPRVPWLTSPVTALPSVALTTVWLQLGLNTVILLANLLGIPEELYESAKIDGAGFRAMFRHITIPMLSPTVFFLIVVDTLAAFQAFTQFNVLTDGGPVRATTVLVYSIYQEFYFNGQYGYASAQAVTLLGIMLVLTILQFGLLERRVFYR